MNIQSMWPRMHMVLIWTMRECYLVFVMITSDQSPFVCELDVIQLLLWRPHHKLPIPYSWKQICPKLQFRKAFDLPDRPVLLSSKVPCKQDGYWPTMLTLWERNWASVKTTQALTEGQRDNVFLPFLNPSIYFPLMLPINFAMNQSAWNASFAECSNVFLYGYHKRLETLREFLQVDYSLDQQLSGTCCTTSVPGLHFHMQSCSSAAPEIAAEACGGTIQEGAQPHHLLQILGWDWRSCLCLFWRLDTRQDKYHQR